MLKIVMKTFMKINPNFIKKIMGIRKTPIRKFPTRKIPTNQLPRDEFLPRKFPPRKFPPGIFPSILKIFPPGFFKFFVFCFIVDTVRYH